MSKQIPLGNDLFTTVDDADYESLSQRKWHALKPVDPRWPIYAVGWPSRKGPVKQKFQDRMHRVIMNPAPDQKVIHKNGDGLDNRRDNLLIVSSSDAHFHSGLSSLNTSGAKGVSFSNKPNIQRRWRAYITIDRKMKNLGYFASFDEAVSVRKAAEERHFKGLARDLEIGPGNPEHPKFLSVTAMTQEGFHALSEIDREARTGVCSQCGPVKIRKGSRDGTSWRCTNKAKEIRRKHHKSINRNRDLVRRPHRKFLKSQCNRCGFIAVHQCQMDIHHRDYDAKNNAPENLETLCANCHRLETQTQRDALYLTTDSSQVWVGARGKFGVKKGGGSANTSGVAGVSWINAKKKWRAVVGVNGESIHLGYFKDFDDAVATRQAAEIEYFGAAAAPAP